MKKRTTLGFDEKFAKILHKKARSTGRTLSGYIRVAVERYIESEKND